MSLDERFGACAAAGRTILAHEIGQPPLSLFELNASSAPMLQAFLNDTPGIITSIFAASYNLLWLVDEPGSVWIAAEELISTSGIRIGALPADREAHPASVTKLGHPSLLKGDPLHARIGGEIIYDSGAHGGARWVLTNKSGRYGLRTGQKEEHLKEVHGIFAHLGIGLGMRFLTPVRDLAK